MLLRDLMNAGSSNDGTRSLLESILIPEVERAFSDWKKSAGSAKCVLIGGVALSFYVKPRTTTDADLLFLTKEDIPEQVEGFKRTRQGAFIHKITHVEIEVLTPQSINMPVEIAQAIYDTARTDGGIKIASPAGLIVSKLGRFSRQDQADIEALYTHERVNLDPFPIPAEWLQRFESIVTNI